MDKRQLTEVIVNLYSSLTPKSTSVFAKNEDVVVIRIVSDSFAGMTFSSRFKMLNEMLSTKEPGVFKQFLFIFEAFTSAELLKLPKDQDTGAEMNSDEIKHSARPLDN